MCRFEWGLVGELRGRREEVVRGGEGSLFEKVCLVCCISLECEIVYTEIICSLLKNHQVVRYS